MSSLYSLHPPKEYSKLQKRKVPVAFVPERNGDLEAFSYEFREIMASYLPSNRRLLLTLAESDATVSSRKRRVREARRQLPASNKGSIYIIASIYYVSHLTFAIGAVSHSATYKLQHDRLAGKGNKRIRDNEKRGSELSIENKCAHCRK